MRILFLGDVMGRSGRDGIKERLPDLQKKYRAEVVIVNVENSAAGFGVTSKLAQEFLADGADCLTTGNHVWGQRELLTSIGQEPRLLRPLNMPDDTPGRGFYVHTLPDGRKILVVNAMGRLFMDPFLDDPFAAMEKLLNQYHLGREVQAIFRRLPRRGDFRENGHRPYLRRPRLRRCRHAHPHSDSRRAHFAERHGPIKPTRVCAAITTASSAIKSKALPGASRIAIRATVFLSAEGEATLCGTFIETDDKTGLATSVEAFKVGGILAG